MSQGLAGIVLAAGRAVRFGGPPGAKLLASFHGRPLATRALDAVGHALSAGTLHAAVCVHRADALGDGVAVLAREAGLEPVPNPDREGGLASSLRVGLAALPATCTAAMIVPGDQPLVRGEVIRTLAEAWARDPRSAVRPGYRAMPDRPGHPVVIPRAAWSLLEVEDEGFGPALRRGGIPLVTIPVDGANPDVDTPADLAALERMPWS